MKTTVGALSIFFVSACNFYQAKEQPREPVKVANEDLSFERVFREVLGPSCVECHGEKIARKKHRVDSYAATLQGLSKYRDRVFDKKTMPPSSRSPLTAAQLDLLSRWMEAGAPELGKAPPDGGTAQPGPAPSEPAIPKEPAPITPTPEPLVPTYSSIHNLILKDRCLGCHMPPSPGAKVPLWPLEKLLKAPDVIDREDVEMSGLLIAITREDNDFKRMPPPGEGQRLSPEEVQVIRRWIEVGTPE